MFRTLIVLSLLLTVSPALAVAEERTLSLQPQPTEVRAYAGVAIFSAWNGSAYVLVASRSGATPQPLPLPPQATPFDADIGPDSAGRPTVVLSRCGPGGCALSLLRLDGSAPVNTSIGLPTSDAVHPTLWRTRVAWLGPNGRVLTRALSGGATRTLSRPPRGAAVRDIELYGRHLAMTTVTTKVSAGICGWREVRLADVESRRSRAVASRLCGLNGQQFFGPSFDGGRLYFALTCNTNGCGTNRYGAYRYNLRTRRYQLAGDGRALIGWAYGGRGTAYQVRTNTSQCSLPGAPCQIVWRDGLRFVPVRAPLSEFPEV